MIYKKQSGFIFPVAALLISIAMLISVISLYLLRQATLIRFDQINKTKTEILDNLTAQFSLNNSIKMSTLDTYQAGQILFIRKNHFNSIMDQTLITHLTLSDKSQFPQFDFNLIFQNKLSCINSKPQQNRLNPAGAVPTAGSSVWPDTCLLSSADYKENLIYEENLQSDSALAIQSRLIASAGYIYLNNKVAAGADLIVLSAGDLYIKHIHSEQHNLTLISTGGMITVDLLTGDPALRLISKFGHFIGGKTYPQSQILLPALKEASIISLQ